MSEHGSTSSFSEAEPEVLMTKEGKRKKKPNKGRWDSKYFITIICFVLVLMINIHLLMKKKGALAGFFFEPKPGLPGLQAEERTNVQVQEMEKSKVYEQAKLPSCDGVPRRNIVFTKTHKTGGTTLTNILLRYAEKHHLITGLPFGDHWELAGYPAKFDKQLIDPILPKYNMMCHHFRYSSEIKEATYPDHSFITMLRDPVKNFESEFGFFRDYPFPQWVGVNGTLENFIESPGKYYTHDTPWYFRAKNYMSFDLGLDHENEDPAYIQSAIAQLEQTYHLVLLTDYFEESLILLKELLCMSDEDLVYLQLKTRTERVDVNPEMSRRIRNWNKLDSAIYDHFYAVFNDKIKEFGTDRMAREVINLRNGIARVKQECVESVDTQREHSWILRNVLRKGATEMCRKMNWGEVKYGDYIRLLQKDWTSVPPQPSLGERESKLRSKQIEILGADYFKENNHR